MGDENNKLREFIKSETLIVTSLPALIYLAAYIYEVGYCAHFNIPTHLISLSLNTILSFAAYIMFILGFFAMLVYLNVKGTQKIKEPFTFLSLILALVFIVITFAYYPLPLAKWFGAGYIPLFIILLIFRKKINNTRFVGIVLKEKLIIFLFFSLTTIFVCLYSGNGNSQSKEIFTVIKNYKNIVILRQYSDLLICAEFNPKVKLIKDELLLLNISNMDSLVLLVDYIGPLEVDSEGKIWKRAKKRKPIYIPPRFRKD